MFYSGLDWSGSPGRDQGSSIVFAIVHLDAAGMHLLDMELAQARVRLGRTPDFAFRHTRAKSFVDIHRRFYEALERVPWSAHVYVLDKKSWYARRAKGSRGTDCLCDGIVSLVIGCPDAVVANQVLFIDLPPGEEKLVQNFRTAMRKSLKGISGHDRGRDQGA